MEMVVSMGTKWSFTIIIACIQDTTVCSDFQYDIGLNRSVEIKSYKYMKERSEQHRITGDFERLLGFCLIHVP